MLDEFVSSYRKLRTDFDPALIRPIIFPQGEMILETRRILMTTFDLLEGLRHIWSCRSLLTEDDYSENAYVIHAVSKVLEKNQDLQILLKLDMKENELVLVEISRSFPEQDKEGLDSKKLVSEIDKLRYKFAEVEAENIKLKAENVKVKAENIEIKAGDMKLKQALEEHETRITNLEQKDKEKIFTSVSQYPVNSNNIPEQIILRSEDVPASSKSNNVSNSGDLNNAPNSNDKSYKKKGTENIAKVIVNGIQNNILSDELEIQSFSFSNNVTKILATDTSSNSSTTPFLIEKDSHSVTCRKRKFVHEEYMELEPPSKKMDLIISLRSYKVELLTLEAGNTEGPMDDTKFRQDHSKIKIVMKDCLDSFWNKLHFKKNELEEVFVMGIQIT
ncbi:4762_t:CDS:2, partial [Entrophospora sp. SA101]